MCEFSALTAMLSMLFYIALSHILANRAEQCFILMQIAAFSTPLDYWFSSHSIVWKDAGAFAGQCWC